MVRSSVHSRPAVVDVVVQHKPQELTLQIPFLKIMWVILGFQVVNLGLEIYGLLTRF